MNISKYIVGILAAQLVSSFSFADHLQIEITTNRSTAAHYLDEATAHLHEVLHHYSNYRHLIRDAQNFKKRTYKFHEAIESGSGYSSAYRRVRSSFKHLSRTFSRAHGEHHNEHLIEYWIRVAAYYEQLRITMSDTYHYYY